MVSLVAMLPPGVLQWLMRYVYYYGFLPQPFTHLRVIASLSQMLCSTIHDLIMFGTYPYGSQQTHHLLSSA